jgi:tellurite resistance protein TerB
MGFFNKFKKDVKKVQNQNTLEAIVAASMLIAAADGDIEKKETDKLDKLLSNNDSLSAFKPSEIRKIIDRYAGILEADFRVGKLKLMKEIGDISDNPDISEEVFVNALAIAESDGEIEAKELTVLKEIGRALGINLSNFDLAA